MHTEDAARQGSHPCWLRLEPRRHESLHADLDHWRANVGAPVAIDVDAMAPAVPAGLDVLCWNVAIGRGRLDVLLDRLRSGAFGMPAGTSTERPLVLLVQEAYRFDETVPRASGSRHHGGLNPGAAARFDIAAVAREHGLSLRYSPSMRNGAHASDRGNAILSTVSLEDAHAFLLPYVRQRRVVVSARVAGLPDMSFVSAHLDTHGSPRDGAWRGIGGGRLAQAVALAGALRELSGSIVLGADLNTFFGMSDPVIRALVTSGMQPARRVGTWRHTFHSRLRLLLDHVLYRSGERRIVSADVVRLDPLRDERSRGVFGSDHYPLFARLELEG
jgi:endonuclease/exonuclease/phosphatase family metal-dependent hydrolase